MSPQVKCNIIIIGYRDDVKLLSFWDTVALGKKNANNNNGESDTDPVPPTPESPCIIMYTSGKKNSSPDKTLEIIV